MRRLTSGLALAPVAWLAACAPARPPIGFEVDAVPATAWVEFRGLDQTIENSIVESCRTPCAVEVHADTWHELRVSAPGYYPARMRFSYEMVATTSTGEGTSRRSRLVVPLFRMRAEAAAPPLER